jgi:hypothetical protein
MSTSVAPLIEFLGLTDFVDHTTERPSFPLGVLYPYTADLRRVCDRYTEVSEAFPATVPLLLGASSHGAVVDEAAGDGVSRYLSSIKTLKGRIDFAPGGVGLAVGEAYRLASLAIRGSRAA